MIEFASQQGSDNARLLPEKKLLSRHTFFARGPSSFITVARLKDRKTFLCSWSRLCSYRRCCHSDLKSFDTLSFLLFKSKSDQNVIWLEFFLDCFCLNIAAVSSDSASSI